MPKLRKMSLGTGPGTFVAKKPSRFQQDNPPIKPEESTTTVRKRHSRDRQKEKVMGFFKRNRQQTQEGAEGAPQKPRGPSDPEMMRMYGPFSDETDALLLEFARIEKAISSGERKDITEAVGDVTFRTRRSNHQHAIEKKFEKPPEGSRAESQLWMTFDRWFKLFCEGSRGYGPDSSFAKDNGTDVDWVHHAIYLVLPGQIKKHNFQAEWAEFAGVKLEEVVTSKARFKEQVYDVVMKKVADDAPKEAEFKAAGKSRHEYLEAVATYDEGIRFARPGSYSRNEIEIWLGLKKRQPRQNTQGATPQAPPMKSPKEVLTEELSELRTKLQELREKMGKDAVAGVSAEELGKTTANIASTEKSVREKQQQLDKLTKPTTQPAPSRLEQVKNIMITDPVTTKPIATVGENQRDKLTKELEKAKADKDAALKAEDGDALKTAKAEIARIEGELAKLDETEKAAAEAAKKAAKPKVKKSAAKTTGGEQPPAPAKVVETEGKVAVAPSDPKGVLALQIAQAAGAGNLELVKELRATMELLG